jgi:hypothetical protein
MIKLFLYHAELSVLYQYYTGTNLVENRFFCNKRVNVFSFWGSRCPLSSLNSVLINRAGIFQQSIGARNRVGIGLSYRPARIHKLAELVPWNGVLGS